MYRWGEWGGPWEEERSGRHRWRGSRMLWTSSWVSVAGENIEAGGRVVTGLLAVIQAAMTESMVGELS